MDLYEYSGGIEAASRSASALRPKGLPRSVPPILVSGPSSFGFLSAAEESAAAYVSRSRASLANSLDDEEIISASAFESGWCPPPKSSSTRRFPARVRMLSAAALNSVWEYALLPLNRSPMILAESAIDFMPNCRSQAGAAATAPDSVRSMTVVAPMPPYDLTDAPPGFRLRDRAASPWQGHRRPG